MSQEKATLKDIANALGVSTTTIHRALNNKSGVSRAMCLKVQELASDMGYSVNTAASALKRKTLRIGVVLPEPVMENRFYYSALWTGIRKYMEGNEIFHGHVTEFYYPLIPGQHGETLKDVYENHLTDIDGLITIGVNRNESSYFIQKIHGAGIPVVIVGSDSYPGACLCCVKAYDEMAGSLAAQLITAFLPPEFSGTIILTGNPVGEAAMPDQYNNLAGFQEQVAATAPAISMRSAYCFEISDLERILPPLVNADVMPFAMYSSSARHTVQMCKIIRDLGLVGQIRLVGNDKFPESETLLLKGVLTAVIDKKVSYQSFKAAEVLMDYLSKGQYPASSTIYVRPEILMKSNLAAETGILS